jgi:signal transduction histidine kinase
LLLQPVYLTHLSLPVFVVISLWLLVQDHLRHQHEHSLHEQALHAQRDRITRDIHDGVGARLNLMLWRTRTTPLVTSQLQDELERSIEELRFAINPQQAADQTLADALHGLCERAARWGQPLGIDVHFNARTTTNGISPEQGLHLYKAAHEALSNALRHSQGTDIDVRLAAAPSSVSLTIQDNGRGIPGWDDRDDTRVGIRSTAMGLRGMQHRLQALGGGCQIESSSHGTCVTLTMPTTVDPLRGKPGTTPPRHSTFGNATTQRNLINT